MKPEIHIFRNDAPATQFIDCHPAERSLLDHSSFDQPTHPFRLARRTGETLELVRGTVGSASLFWATNKTGEIGVCDDLLMLARWRGKLAFDASKLAEFARDEEVADSRTYFAGLQRVLPGEIVRLGPSGRVSRQWWWQPPVDHSTLTIDEAAASISDILQENLRELSRQRCGLMLSAGMDSSILALASAEASIEDLRAYCGVPQGDHRQYDRFVFDEGALANGTADLIGIPFEAVEAHTASILGLHRSMLRHLHQPFANLGNLPWIDAVASRAAAEGCEILIEGGLGNVVLSHDGSDALRSAVRDGRWRDAKGHLQRHWRAGRGTGLMCFVRGLYDRLARKPDTRRRRLSELRTFDSGPYNRAYQVKYGLHLFDPTADRRLLDLAIALGEDVHLTDGYPRALARRMLGGRVPEDVASGRLRGLQGADWRVHLRAGEQDIRDLLGRSRDRDIEIGVDWSWLDRELQRALDFEGIETVEEMVGRQQLLRALAALDFADWVEGGCE